jgi:heat shock protein HtpX
MRNIVKTYILLGILTGIIVAVGNLVGGTNGAIVALILAGIMNFLTYYFSDSLVLTIYGAKAVSKEEAPELYSVVTELASKFSMPIPRLYIIETEAPNAFATGRNPNNAAVAVTSGILKILNLRELRGVLAHELSHIKNRDILIGTIAATLAGAITLLARMLWWFGGVRHDNDRRSANPIFAILFIVLAPIAAALIQLAISRAREYLADETGGRTCEDPLSLASALEKLDAWSRRIPLQANPATSHLFIVKPFSGEDFLNLFSTHPPIPLRIQRLKELAEELRLRRRY